MNISISIGWWLLPTIPTIAWVIFFLSSNKDDIFSTFTIIIFKLLLLIPILLSWIAYLSFR